MNHRLWRSAVGALLLMSALVISACSSGAQATNAAPSGEPSKGMLLMSPPKQLSDFTLTSTSGEPLSLSSLRGSTVVMFFGYTHCPDFCPATLGEYKRIKQGLGDAANNVKFVFVSVDGERDTPPVLKKYVETFDPTFIGLTGDAPTLDRIAPEFGLYYKLRKDEGTGGNYPVDHITLSYVIDRDGKLVAAYPYGMDMDTIIKDLQKRATA